MSTYVGRHRAATPARTHATGRTLGVSAVAAVGLAVPAAADAAPAAPAAPAATPAVTAAALPAMPIATRTNFRGTIRVGHRGWIVGAVQRRVGVKDDGVFLWKTQYAVKRWQRKHGLKADGVVGPATGSRMNLPAKYTAPTRKKAKRTTVRSSRSTARSSSIVTTAARYYGTPYRYGGTSPSGFDCSGFTGYVYKQHGKNLPRTAEQQRQRAWRTSNPKPGDLVFFGSPSYHVGIYAGNGKIIDAGSSGGRVSKRSIWTNAVSYGRV